MAELNELLDAAAQAADTLSAQMRATLAELTLGIDGLLAEQHAVLDASHARVAAMTERLGAWEDDLAHAGEELAAVRERVRQGADEARSEIEQLLAFARAEIEERLPASIEQAEQDLGARFAHQLEALAAELERLQADDARLEEANHALRDDALAHLRQRVDHGAHELSSAQAQWIEALDKQESATHQALSELEIGIVTAAVELEQQAANVVGAVRERLTTARGEAREKLLGEGIDKLREAEQAVAELGPQMQLQLQRMMSRVDRAFEAVGNATKSVDDTVHAMVDNLRG